MKKLRGSAPSPTAASRATSSMAAVAGGPATTVTTMNIHSRFTAAKGIRPYHQSCTARVKEYTRGPTRVVRGGDGSLGEAVRLRTAQLTFDATVSHALYVEA